jgi:hypothetical protein
MIIKRKDQPQGPWLKNGNPVFDLQSLPRCKAKARSRNYEPCRQPAMENGCCRYHGGKSPGAAIGNSHAFKHGLFTQRMIEQRQEVAQLIRDSRSLLREIR